MGGVPGGEIPGPAYPHRHRRRWFGRTGDQRSAQPTHPGWFARPDGRHGRKGDQAERGPALHGPRSPLGAAYGPTGTDRPPQAREPRPGVALPDHRIALGMRSRRTGDHSGLPAGLQPVDRRLLPGHRRQARAHRPPDPPRPAGLGRRARAGGRRRVQRRVRGAVYPQSETPWSSRPRPALGAGPGPRRSPRHPPHLRAAQEPAAAVHGRRARQGRRPVLQRPRPPGVGAGGPILYLHRDARPLSRSQARACSNRAAAGSELHPGPGPTPSSRPASAS